MYFCETHVNYFAIHFITLALMGKAVLWILIGFTVVSDFEVQYQRDGRLSTYVGISPTPPYCTYRIAGIFRENFHELT